MKKYNLTLNGEDGSISIDADFFTLEDGVFIFHRGIIKGLTLYAAYRAEDVKSIVESKDNTTRVPLVIPESTILSMGDLNKAIEKASLALDELIKDVGRIKNDRGGLLYISANNYQLSSAFLDYAQFVRNDLFQKILTGAFVEKK